MSQIENYSSSEVTYRLITGIVFLTLAGGAAIVMLTAIQMIDPTQIFGSWRPGRQVFAFLNGMAWINRLSVAAGSGIMGVLFLVMLSRLLSPAPPAAVLHMLDADDVGFVVVDSRGIATIAEQAAISTHGVVNVAARVKAAGAKSVGLRLEIGVYPGADVKSAGNEVREVVRDAVENLVGLEVRDVAVKAHVLEPDALGRVMR